MFRFIHAADIHLDSPLRRLEQYEGAPIDEIRLATREALRRLVDLAIEESVDLLLIAGDIYDGDWEDYETGLFFNSQMQRLAAVEIPVVMIAGNHDADNVMTRSLALPDNVRMLSSTEPQTHELTEQRVAVHGQGFADRAVLDNLAAGYPNAKPNWFNIGLLHTCATGDSGHAAYAPCKVADLTSKGYDYWALGHVHDRRQLHHDDEPPIWFSGNLQGRHPKETGAKGCLLVQVTDDAAVDVEFRAVDVFRWEQLELDLGEVDDEVTLLNQFRDALDTLRREHAAMPLAVRVRLVGSTPLHGPLHAEAERWQNELRAAAIGGSSPVWIEQVRIEVEPPARLMDDLPTDGPLGELRDYLSELRADEGALESLSDDLSDLYALSKQLPPELSNDLELAFHRAESIRELLDDVEPLLLHRLQAEGSVS